MVSPLLIAAGAVAAVGTVAYLLSRGGADAPGAALPSTPIVSPKPAEYPYGVLPPSREDFDDLSAKLDDLVTQLEKNKAASPQYVDAIGKQFGKRGFGYTHMRLADSAAARYDALDGIPYMIMPGDIASIIALKYAGDGLRWRELIGRQSSHGVLKQYTDPNGWQQLAPWIIGQTILLPLDWTKGAPQVLKPPVGKVASPSTDWAKM